MRKGRARWYNGVIDVPEGTSGDITISHKIEPAGTTLRSDNLRMNIFGQKGEAITFQETTRWHTLSEEGQGVWMTDQPIEQRQHDDILKHAHGRVLVGGLGLGYAVVALAQRPRVREIVVVERNADIIKLVWEATVAKVPPHIKVSVVHADLFDYLAARASTFTWGFFDIWQGDGESTFHETVVPLRAAADGMVKTVECWNEDIMRAQLYQGMQTRLMLLKHQGLQPALNGMMVNLDTLCSEETNIYVRWAAPFWRWYRDNAALLEDDGTLDYTMQRYVIGYGRPEQDHGLMFLRSLRPRARQASA